MMKNPAAVRELEAIRDEGRKLAVYDLAKAMQEAAEVIEFAKKHKHPTAYFFAVRHRAHLSGLLVDKIQLETTVDLKGALAEARGCVINTINITPGHVSAVKALTAAPAPFNRGPAFNDRDETESNRGDRRRGTPAILRDAFQPRYLRAVWSSRFYSKFFSR